MTDPAAIVVIEPGDLEYAREVAADNGVEIEDVSVHGFEPVTTVTLALYGGALAVGAVLFLLDRRKGGQVIDLRDGIQQKFYRSDDIAFGLVVIIAADGKIAVEVKEPRGMFGAVIESLTKASVDLGKAGLDAIAAAARTAVGDKADVEVVRARVG